MDLENFISKWSLARLIFFLKLRNIEIPPSPTKQELVELVKANSTVPILSVEISPYFLENLTHQQLLNYLLERNYAVISKANIRASSSDATATRLTEEVLKFALKDYKENIAPNPHKFNKIIPKILLLEESKPATLYKPESDKVYDQFAVQYKEINLDFVLRNFGAKDLLNLSPDEKLDFVNKSVKYLVSGTA